MYSHLMWIRRHPAAAPGAAFGDGFLNFLGRRLQLVVVLVWLAQPLQVTGVVAGLGVVGVLRVLRVLGVLGVLGVLSATGAGI
jgi:hypothetical protein